MRASPTALGILVLATLGACSGIVGEPGLDPGETMAPPVTTFGPSSIRTLTPAQYRNSVTDVLGLDVPVDAVGQWGSAIAAARGGIAPATVLAYEEEARAAAAYALDPSRRDSFVSCTPVGSADDACARELLARLGRRAFRRALTGEELARYAGLAAEIGTSLGDPYRGLEHAIAALLQSPNFLYRVELGEPDPSRAGVRRYTSHEMATRISYLVWNTTPDAELLDAAERGELDTPDGVRIHVTRLLADARARTGARELFGDLFDADEILTTEKDLGRYPFFTPTLREAIRDQLLLTAESAVFSGDYRALFTTRETFMNRELAALYGVEGTFGDELVPYTFEADSPRGGVLTLAGFVVQHAYPAKTSPALRGLFVRKTLLCQDIPPPPADVATVLPEPAPGELVTTRQLLEERHEDEEVCASCHRFMDPIGLALEPFDAVGQFRATENDLPIDPSGNLDGAAFEDARGLGEALAEHPALARCFVQNLHAYASGHTVFPGEHRAIDAIAEELDANGYRVEDAIVAIATSEVFRFAADVPVAPPEAP